MGGSIISSPSPPTTAEMLLVFDVSIVLYRTFHCRSGKCVANLREGGQISFEVRLDCVSSVPIVLVCVIFVCLVVSCFSGVFSWADVPILFIDELEPRIGPFHIVLGEGVVA